MISIQLQYWRPFNFIAEAKGKKWRLKTDTGSTKPLNNKSPELKVLGI
jgi:hypothetical protein